MGMVVRDRLQ